MRRLLSSLASLPFAVLWCSAAVYAQEQTGSIQGSVKDSLGGVLPGVTVEARSPTVVGVTVAVSNERGTYRFPALPPATYTITATLDGFNSGKVENATLWLGQTLKIDFELKIAGIAEQVDVVATSPLIDVKQSAAFATVEQQALEHLPKGRDYTSVIILAPGAQYEPKSGGEAQIDGASGSENRFIIDGMDTTRLLGGTSGKSMPIDFIEQVQVKSSGYAAEFGGSTGGVVSAITKSGSNQLRGSAGLYYQTDAFYGTMRPLNAYSPWDTNRPEPGLIPTQTPWTYLNPVGDVGGPVLRDKLWYYAGFAYQSNSYHEDAIFITDPTYTNRHFEWGNFSYMPNYNVTTQLSKGMRLRVSGSNQRGGERKTAPGGPLYTAGLYTVLPANLIYTGTDPNLRGKSMAGYTGATFPTLADGSFDQATYDRQFNKYATDNSNDMFSVNFDWVTTPTVFLNTTAGYFRTNYWTSPEMRGNDIVRMFAASNSNATMIRNGFPTVPSAYQQAAGYRDNIPTSGTVRDIYSRLYVNANGTWYKSAAGQHLLKAGVRLERYTNDVFSGLTRPTINLAWGRRYQKTTGEILWGKYGYYTVRQTATVGQVASNNIALWLQDSWAVNNKLTINAGIRAENEEIPAFNTGDTPGVAFGFGDKIAPRIGFAYDLRGDSKWKVYGSFGYFYDITKLDLAQAYFGALDGRVFVWSLDTYDWKSISCEAQPTGCPGTLMEEFNMIPSYNEVNQVLADYFQRPGMTSVDPTLKPYQTGEFVVGVDHELTPTMSLGARYVHKWLFRTIEDMGLVIPEGPTYDAGTYFILGNPGYGYSEVMIPSYPQFPTPHAKRDYDALELRFRKRFSGRWSAELDYTYSRLYGNYSGLASSDENGRVSPNISAYFDVIYQSYDDRQQEVVGRLATDRPHVLKLWATYDFPWGTSIGITGMVESGLPQTSTFLWQGYPTYFNGRGDLGRTPWITQFGLQVSQAFRLGGSRRIIVEADIVNLFDSDTVTGFYSTNKYRDNVKPPDSLFFGGPWTPESVVAQYPELGIRSEAFYLTPNAFQQRREARVMVKFSF